MIVCNTRNLQSPMTGVQRYTQEILQRLPAEKVRAVAPYKHLRRPLNLVWEQTMLPFRLGGDLLWSPGNTGPLVVKNQVVTVHDLATVYYPQDFSKPYLAYYQWLFPRLLPQVKGILTVSEYTKQTLMETYRLPSEKICVTPLGVDHSRFYPRKAAEIAELREKLGLGGRFALYLGTLSPRKNIARVVEAWRQAQAALDDDVTLVIAGGSGLAHVFNGEALPPLPPRTQLLGRISDADLPVLLSAAEVFLFPSLFEGFGLPPLEAMACGTPSITSNTTSLPEVVGEAGLTVNPTDIAAIAGAIVQLFNNPTLRNQLARQGLQRVKEFDWQATATKTWEFLSR